MSSLMPTIPDYWMTHPERRTDEFFITNVIEDHSEDPSWRSYFHKIGWLTKRMGNIAYDKFGAVISDEGGLKMRPVFVKQSEVRESLNLRSLKNKKLMKKKK